jgi:hypothetical protein
MIKFLFDNCKDFPVIGTPIKVAYIGYLVKNIIKEGKGSESTGELSNLTGDELEDAINNQATNQFDQFVMPEITKHGIPDFVVNPSKEKMIDKLAGAIREKIQKKAEEKILGKKEEAKAN